MAGDKLVTLGKVGKTHGIKGWVRLYSFTDPVSNIADYQQFLVSGVKHQGNLVMDHVQPQGDHLIAHFEGIDDPGAAQSLVGAELKVPAEELPELRPDEFYWHQLVGLQVVNQQGQLLGRVARLLETGANDVLVVQPCKGSIDCHERLIPYLRDRVVGAVDLEKGVIDVDWAADFLL